MTEVCLDRVDNFELDGIFEVSLSRGFCLDRVDKIEFDGMFALSHSQRFA